MKSKRKIQFYKLIQIKKNRLKEQGPDHKKTKLKGGCEMLQGKAQKTMKKERRRKKKFNHRQTTRN
jgi:hypothetical protein